MLGSPERRTSYVSVQQFSMWYGRGTAQGRKDLAQVVRRTQEIVDSPLTNLDSLYANRIQRKVRRIENAEKRHSTLHCGSKQTHSQSCLVSQHRC